MNKAANTTQQNIDAAEAIIAITVALTMDGELAGIVPTGAEGRRGVAVYRVGSEVWTGHYDVSGESEDWISDEVLAGQASGDAGADTLQVWSVGLKRAQRELPEGHTALMHLHSGLGVEGQVH